MTALRRMLGIKRTHPDAPPGADRPNLLLCGAQRCGTTTLKTSLERHPEIGFLSEQDLVHQGAYCGYPFASPSLAGAEAGAEDLYRSISSRLAGKRRWIGVKWPYFMFYAHIPFAIREQLPDARLLFILRDPVEAAHSSFRSGNSGDTSADAFASWVNARLEETRRAASVENREEWLASFGPGTHTDLSLERGLYAPQIERFARLFPQDQWKVVRFESFAADPTRELAGVLAWLGLDPARADACAVEPMNAAPRSEGVSPETREKLARYYSRSNSRLFDLLGWPAEPWSRS